MNDQFDELAKNLTRPLTRRQAFKTFGASLAGVALARLGANHAQAITFGTLDGDAHPNVGAGVFLKSLWPPAPAPVICGSGILIHPRVLLTAGHGTYLVETAIGGGIITLQDFLVSLASNAYEPGSWRALSGIFTHPGYLARAQADEGAGSVPQPDVGVLIFKKRVTGVPVVPLPPLGFLDALQTAGMLPQGAAPAKFTVVGYGVSLSNPQEDTFPPDGLRRVAQSEFLNLHDHWLFLNQNFAQAIGGTASCDSGGPVYWVDPGTGQTTLVALTSRGDGANANLGVYYRVDTLEALTFINAAISMVEAGQL